MMDSRRTQKWLMISFFTSVSLFFIYFIFALVTGTTDSTYQKRLAGARSGPGSYHADTRVSLVRDQTATVGRLQLTYRGIASGHVLLDVVLLDLDPEYVYSRKITKRNAKKGFAVSGLHFKATSINSKRLRLDLQNR